MIDDVAESFDYQNKYAIAEYLKEISDNENFRAIILTHNFDFFRTLKSRLDEDKEGDWFYLAEKGDEGIKLMSQDDHFIDPFKDWKLKLIDCNEEIGVYVYATILMRRNIIDYSGIHKEKLDFLNDVIHGRKDDFEEVKMNKIEQVLIEVGLDKTSFSEELRKKKYFDFLHEIVNEVI